MSYIGNTLPANFQSLPAVQRFNGDGSDTTFTLAAQIANDQSILVSVDGVTQDSNAYSVSGTTLTFTAAPSAGTGNIFVNTISPVGSTITHPASDPLSASTGTFSGAVSGTTGTFSTSVATTKLDVNIDTNARLQSATNISEVGSGVFALQVGNQAESALKPMGFRAEDIRFATGNAIRARVTDNGITFNADTAAANALDDYEEGTWSPQIYLQNSTDQSNASNQTQDGRYTKIGNIVTLQFSLIFTLGSSLNNDNIGVKNFPFTSSATIKAVGGVMQSTSLTSGAGYLLFVEPSGSKALLLTGAGGGNLADEVGSGSGKQLYGSIVYQTG